MRCVPVCPALCILCFRHRQILVRRTKISASSLLLILFKDTFHNIRNLCFDRLKQNHQILHGAVARADIHLPDMLLNHLSHQRKRLFDRLNPGQSLCIDFHRNHDQITLPPVADDQLMNVFILSCEITIIQIQRSRIASACLQRLCDLLQILPAGGSPGNQLRDFVIEAELILSVLLDVIEGLIRLGIAIRKRFVSGTTCRVPQKSLQSEFPGRFR